MKFPSVHRKDALFACAGACLLTPALLVCLSDPLKLRADLPLIHPAAVLGGLLIAGASNALAAMGVRLRVAERAFVAEIRIEKKWLNLGVVAVGAALGLLLLGYGFVENFAVVSRG